MHCVGTRMPWIPLELHWDELGWNWHGTKMQLVHCGVLGQHWNALGGIWDGIGIALGFTGLHWNSTGMAPERIGVVLGHFWDALGECSHALGCIWDVLG